MIPWVHLTYVDVIAVGHLRLTWDDGVTRDVDVTGWMRRHALLEMLNDPMVFRDAALINRGGGVGWPNGADFCAQALRMLSDEQLESRARMTA